MNITFEDVKIAYKKLKSYVYYDSSNTNVQLRKVLAYFENSHKDNIEDFFEALANAINCNESHFDALIENIKIIKIPKTFKDKDKDCDTYCLSNIRTFDSYNVKKYYYFIDADISLHLVSVLWLMKIGYLLDSKLENCCLGNRLALSKEDKTLNNNLNLFKHYFTQYQEWRDVGVKTAQDLLANKKNVAIINLDISDYYYSVNFSFKTLLDHIDIKENISQYEALNRVFIKVHEHFTNIYKMKNNGKSKKVNTISVVLPIGLLSSTVLANWYLHEFDGIVLQELNPAYYGRYVDDLLIVLSNPKISFKQGGDNTGDIHNFVKYNLNKILITNTNEGYNLTDYNNLVIQAEKILLYIFKYDETTVALEKLRQDISERSSEFRFFPEDEANIDFDQKAYELIYDNSFGKIRTLKDYKESKYGLSIYLAKIISCALRSSEKDFKKETGKLLLFFKGYNVLNNYQLWEKVFTYLIIINDHKAFVKLFKNIVESINLIEVEPGEKNELLNDLFNHLKISIEISLSLKPIFMDEKTQNSLKYVLKNQYDININTDPYRYSNLVRHHYVIQPLINYTNAALDKTISYIDKHFQSDYLMKDIQKYELSSNSITFTPRYLKYYEIIVYKFYLSILYSLGNKKNNILCESNDCKEVLNTSFELYKSINGFLYSRDSVFTTHAIPVEGIDTIAISVKNGKKKGKIKIGLANIQIQERNILSSLMGTPNLGTERYRDYIKLLNYVEEDGADIFIMPEFSIPFDFVPMFSEYSARHNKVLILGLEHIVVGNSAYNFVLTVIPFEHNNIKDAIVIPRLKNHYAPIEVEKINGYRLTVPTVTPSKYNIFNWNGIYFTVFYCYELCNIKHRAAFRSLVDLFIVSEYNKDTEYFSSIVDSASRDIHCYVVQVNTAQYGDSRITQPSKSIHKNIIQLKGGENPVVLIGTIDVDELRQFQLQEYILQKDHPYLKPTPPEFDKNNVILRINNTLFEE